MAIEQSIEQTLSKAVRSQILTKSEVEHFYQHIQRLLSELDDNDSENTTYWMTGNHLIYLLVYLNSPLSAYLFSKLGNTTGAGTIRWQKFKVGQQLVPLVSSADEQRIIDLYRSYQQTGDESLLQKAYYIIYKTVGLNDAEIEYINNKNI